MINYKNLKKEAYGLSIMDREFYVYDFEPEIYGYGEQYKILMDNYNNFFKKKLVDYREFPGELNPNFWFLKNYLTFEIK